ncbi:hypothetical protein BKA57DRAFT_37645 [Linnemannia elongata]|nr:hypothetical protein BKA57DRAFT_37645 [Linnemannia elongata]
MPDSENTSSSILSIFPDYYRFSSPLALFLSFFFFCFLLFFIPIFFFSPPFLFTARGSTNKNSFARRRIVFYRKLYLLHSLIFSIPHCTLTASSRSLLFFSQTNTHAPIHTHTHNHTRARHTSVPPLPFLFNSCLRAQAVNPHKQAPASSMICESQFSFLSFFSDDPIPVSDPNLPYLVQIKKRTKSEII